MKEYYITIVGVNSVFLLECIINMIKELIKFGVSAIIQPGGSINDQKVIEAANKAGIVMAFTGTRHFKH